MGCQVIGIYFSYLFFIVCIFLLFFLFPTWARNTLFWFGFCALLLSFFSPGTIIEHIFWGLDAFVVFKFYFYLEYSTRSSSVLGRHVLNQSLPVLEYFVLFWKSQTPLPLHSHFRMLCGISARWLFGFTTYLRALLILLCSAVFVCLRDTAILWLFHTPVGYSPHTSLSALNIRSSLLSQCCIAGGWVFFSGGGVTVECGMTQLGNQKSSLERKGPGEVSRSLLYSIYFYNHLFIVFAIDAYG